MGITNGLIRCVKKRTLKVVILLLYKMTLHQHKYYFSAFVHCFFMSENFYSLTGSPPPPVPSTIFKTRRFRARPCCQYLHEAPSAHTHGCTRNCCQYSAHATAGRFGQHFDCSLTAARIQKTKVMYYL